MKERDYQWGMSATNKKRVLGVLGFLEVTTIIMVRENDNIAGEGTDQNISFAHSEDPADTF